MNIFLECYFIKLATICGTHNKLETSIKTYKHIEKHHLFEDNKLKEGMNKTSQVIVENFQNQLKNVNI